MKVAVVDEAFVRKFFKPGENPIGTHFGVKPAGNEQDL